VQLETAAGDRAPRGCQRSRKQQLQTVSAAELATVRFSTVGCFLQLGSGRIRS